MAKVIFAGLEHLAANQIGRVLQTDKHEIEIKSDGIQAEEMLDADIVFAGGSGKRYLGLLNSIRQRRPEMPFVVVTSSPETTDWLDALEAGATDYCSAPFEPRQVKWVMESAMRRLHIVAAA